MKAFLKGVAKRLLKVVLDEAVLADAKQIASDLNARIDIPLLNEEQEQAVFENVLEALQQALA